MPTACLVIDATDERTTHSVDIEAETTLLELHHIIASLGLPSCAAEFAICHDGSLLDQSVDEEATLEALGVHGCPVVVVCERRRASSPAKATTAPAAAAAGAPATAEAAATTAADVVAGASSVAAELGRAALDAVATASSATPLIQAVPDDAVCRICFSGSEEGRLIRPCLCSGSMQYVHVHCLNEWRTQSANPRSFYECDQCNYKYNLERTKYAAYLEDARVVRGAAALLMLTALVLGAVVLGGLGAEQHFYRLVDFHPTDAWQWGRRLSWVARAWCWQLDYLVAGLLGLAVVGLHHTVRQAYQMNRMNNNGWIMGVVTAFAVDGVRIARVFAAGGVIYSTRVAVSVVEGAAKEMLTRWGTAILEVQR